MSSRNRLNPEDDDELSIESSLRDVANKTQLSVNAKEFVPGAVHIPDLSPPQPPVTDTTQPTYVDAPLYQPPPPIDFLDSPFQYPDTYTNDFIQSVWNSKANDIPGSSEEIECEFQEDDIPDNIDDLVYQALYNNANDKKREVCRYFLQGNCRYGDHCIRSHNPKEKMISFEEDIAQSRDIHCAICDDSIVETGKRFGLLTQCDHPFCIDCIRKWRAQTSIPREVRRTCPLCRTPSFFIVPSTTYIRDPYKKYLITEAYKSNMKTIPCRFFKYGERLCPFGDSCFYLHVDNHGNECNQRTLYDMNGNARPAKDILLSDIIDIAVKKKEKQGKKKKRK